MKTTLSRLEKRETVQPSSLEVVGFWIIFMIILPVLVLGRLFFGEFPGKEDLPVIFGLLLLGTIFILGMIQG